MDLDSLTNEDIGDIATLFASKERWPAALPFYMDLANRMQGNPDALAYLALAQLKTGRISGAEFNVGTAVRDHPDHAFGHSIMALVKQELADFAGAEISYREAIKLADNPAFRSSYAYLLQILGRYEESEMQYDMAIDQQPTNLEARFFRALTILTQGRFREGCPDYELRYALKPSPVPLNGKTIWRGVESLVGKTVLLCAYEQGIGDAIQFVRYAAWLHSAGAAEVIALVRPELQLLVAHVPGVDMAVTSAEDAGRYDFAVPAMSCMGLSLDFHEFVADGRASFAGSRPWYGSTPYIFDPGRFSGILPSGRLKVGFCFQGQRAHGNDKYRSIPREKFDSLLGDHICAINLQHDIEYDTRLMLNPEIGSILELTRLINELDLVITVDTAIAHIAGALNIPVWILLPLNADFRWGLDRPSTPWYKSAVLWRAKEPLQWEPVLEEVRTALMNMATVHKTIGA